jgi:AcrR family transcriptional regulator
MPVREKARTDRRVRKTEALLREALGDLIRERRYEDIVVKEILGRANVGRSTFYTHFADKDDLLVSCIEEILRSAPEAESVQAAAGPHQDLLWFSPPILRHVERHRGTALVEQAHLHDMLAEYVEREMGMALRQRSAPRQAPPDLLARWIASTFVLVLDHWLESAGPISARDADRLFRALVEPSLAAALDG